MKTGLCWNHDNCDRSKCIKQRVDDPEEVNVLYKDDNCVIYSPSSNKESGKTVMRRSMRDLTKHRTEKKVVHDGENETKQHKNKIKQRSKYNDVVETSAMVHVNEQSVAAESINVMDKEEDNVAAAVTIVDTVVEGDDVAVVVEEIVGGDEEDVKAAIVHENETSVAAESINIIDKEEENVAAAVTIDDTVVEGDDKEELNTKVIDATTQTELLQPQQYQKMVDQLNESANQLSVYKKENADLLAKQADQSSAYSLLYEQYTNLLKDWEVRFAENNELKPKFNKVLRKSEPSVTKCVTRTSISLILRK